MTGLTIRYFVKKYIINAIGFNIGKLADEYRIGDKIDVLFSCRVVPNKAHIKLAHPRVIVVQLRDNLIMM